MAVPRVSDDPAIQHQYAAQLAVSATLFAALRALWASVNPLSSTAASSRYREGVAVLVTQYAGASSSIAADFYLAARAESGITGAVAVPPIDSPPRSQIDAGLDWALREIEKEMQGRLLEIEKEMQTEIDALFAEQQAAQAKVEAAAQKIVTDAARRQVIAAVEGDDKALGYRRVPRPDACPWCLVLAFRTSTRKGLAKDFKKYGPGTLGAVKHYGVYKSRSSAGQIAPDAKGDTNRFHDNCHCVVAPVFNTLNQLPVWLHDMETVYNASEDFNGFRRAIRALRNGREPEPPSVPVPSVVKPPTEQIDALLDRLSHVA